MTELERPDGREVDNPALREDEFFARWASNPSVWEGYVADGVEHRRKAAVDTVGSGWTPLGPRNVGGAVRCIAQHATKPQTLFAGSAWGGLWRTDDAGYSWSPVDALPGPVPVGAVAVAPADPRVLYVGTGELAYQKVSGIGLYRSRDEGLTFDRIAGPTDLDGATHYGRIVVDPGNPERMWVATDTGLWRFEGTSASREGTGLPKDRVNAGATELCRASDVAISRYSKDPTKWLLLCALEHVGIYRALVPTRGGSHAWARSWDATAHPMPTRRVLLAVHAPLRSTPTGQHAYAVMEEFLPDTAAKTAAGHAGSYPTEVLRSTDWGETFAVPAGATRCSSPPAFPAPHVREGQGYYSMCITVVPDQPESVIVGHVNLHLSTDHGVTWDVAPAGGTLRLLDEDRYETGASGFPGSVDVAQHADQHNLLWDWFAASRRALWVVNDGGISFAADVAAVTSNQVATGWRKRSFGISAAQLNDITAHPTFPSILGGGMQDNGTFIGYGRGTWYEVSNADGGSVNFVASDPRRLLAATQQTLLAVSFNGATPPGFTGSSVLSYQVDDRPSGRAVVEVRRASVPFPGASEGVFNGLHEEHHTVPGLVVIARKGGAFYTTDYAQANQLNLPAMAATEEVTAIGSAGNARDLWIGTSLGQLFFSAQSLPATAAPASGAVASAGPVGSLFASVAIPAGLSLPHVMAIAVYARNANVVALAISVGRGGGAHVYLSHDKGATWSMIATAADELPNGAIPSLHFHPTDSRVLFAATIAGVYVTRELPAREAGSAALGSLSPKWRLMSVGLPGVLVTDLSLRPEKQTLMCATYGRGAYECAIPGFTPANFDVPAVRLGIGRYFSDDSYVYANPLFDDPRLPAPAVPATDHDWLHAPDIRVDAPDLQRNEAFAFGANIDGVEFDQTLVADSPLAGDINHVYVQVHNHGYEGSGEVQLHLYFATAPSPTTPPPIDAAALNFPDDPLPGSAWQRIAVEPIGVRPGEPLVERVTWIPPLAVGPQVALLALVTGGADAIAPIVSEPVEALVRRERRAALRVMDMRRQAILMRDGFDDAGSRGAVAWGGHSPDIIVRQAAIAAPLGAAPDLTDLNAAHLADVVRPGANFVYVRVHNRARVPLDRVRVRLFRLPRSRVTESGRWPIDHAVGGAAGVATDAIPVGGWGVAQFDMNVAGDPDPDMTGSGKGVVLVAMASVEDAAGTVLIPYPDLSSVTDVASFWRFFTAEPLAANVAIRALNFQP